MDATTEEQIVTEGQTVKAIPACEYSDPFARSLPTLRRPNFDDLPRTPNRMTDPRTAADAIEMDHGIWVREINGHRVFLGIQEDGTPIPGIGVPIGDQTDDDVIAALAAVVYPSRRLQLVAGASAPVAPGYVPPRVSLRLEPSPPRFPQG